MVLRSSRLLGRTLDRTLSIVGSLALRLGIARKVLLILGGIAALVVLGMFALAFALFSG